MGKEKYIVKVNKGFMREGDDQRNEAAVSALARVLDLDHSAPSQVWEVSESQWKPRYSIQKLEQGKNYTGGRKLPIQRDSERVSSESLQKTILLNILANTEDRHSGNYLINAKLKTITSIDNGWSFSMVRLSKKSTYAYKLLRYQQFGSSRFGEYHTEFSRSIIKDIVSRKSQAIEELKKYGLDSSEISDFQTRFEELESALQKPTNEPITINDLELSKGSPEWANSLDFEN